VAVLDVVRGGAEVRSARGGWTRAVAGAPLATGDSVRVSPEGLAQVRLAWVRLLLGPSTVAGLGPSRVLSATLEEGRLEQRSERGILKLRTPEAEVRGRGHLVLRREARRTLVSVLAGEFRVLAGRKVMTLRANQGALVAAGQAMVGPVPLPPAPAALRPGADPLYVRECEAVPLAWTAAASTHHVQLLPSTADDVLMALDVGAGPVTLADPGLGTFRWRVAARSGDGLEGPPSVLGAFAVVQK
jgi:hypothetical protein